ncbi:MAG: hypothetical protein ABIH92_03640 [Nanoarchaeota archaeon]
MKQKKRLIIRKREVAILAALVLLEWSFFVFLFSFFPIGVWAGVSEDNVTVQTFMQIGNAFPEIVNITINNGNDIDLTANATTNVSVLIILRDYNGDTDIENVTAEFFDNIASSYGSADDNNDHYTNSTCFLNRTYGSSIEASATCTFDLEYYANNATWNATVSVNDSLGSQASNSNTTTVNTLLAFALPDSIDYGEVNATTVSAEKEVNVTNAGNVVLNLSLHGYGATEGDNLAMNCTQGSVQNISAFYEQYNLTASNASDLTFSQFDGLYINLSGSPVINWFDLTQRQNDTDQYVDDTNSTYWRIYVPVGVAGNCSGNIVFGAVQSPAS